MLKLSFQLIHDGNQVRHVGLSVVVAFEGFNKALGHAIASRALHRCSGFAPVLQDHRH